MSISDIKIKVTVDYRHWRWEIASQFGYVFGMDSVIARFMWWFIEPVRIKVGTSPWQPVTLRQVTGRP